MAQDVHNKRGAGLRRSALAERIRVQEEWSSLKGVDEKEPEIKKQTKARSKSVKNNRDMLTRNMLKLNIASQRDKQNMPSSKKFSSEALRGVVALVDLGSEARALPLRAALSALGASVAVTWSPLVTHLVWSQGGCRETRARARALACEVVSPLWVEACASAARRVAESFFPSTARASDLPSPATLCQMLKKAERDNLILADVSDSSDDRPARLRISSDTDNTKSIDEDTTKESVDPESRVNTAPRRVLPISLSPPHNPKTRRKLFTARAEGDTGDEDESDAENIPGRGNRNKAPGPDKGRNLPKKGTIIVDKAIVHVAKDPVHVDKAPTRVNKAPTSIAKAPTIVRAPERQKKKHYNLTQEHKKNLEKASRMARTLAGTKPTNKQRETTQTQRRQMSNTPRIVLSGMPRAEYHLVSTAVRSLNGRLQKHVNHRTTHVLLGCCNDEYIPINGKTTPRKTQNTICTTCHSPRTVLTHVLTTDVMEVNQCENCVDNQNVHNVSDLCDGIKCDKSLRTLKTLLGAVRGCRVLHAQWALDSFKHKKWVLHAGYEVAHLMKVNEKARAERYALGKMHSEYAYNVFRGTRVYLSHTADQRDAAFDLLSLCGAVIVSEHTDTQNTQSNGFYGNRVRNGGGTQNGGFTQDGGATQNCGSDCNIVRVGRDIGEVSSKWVFDSVAAGRVRTTRRYVNIPMSED